MFLKIEFIVRSFLTVFLSISFSQWSEGALSPQSRITLEEAIQLAVENSPALKMVNKELRIKELESSNSFLSLLPTLDFNTSYGVQGGTFISSPNEKISQYNFQLTENLYDNGVTWTKYSSAQLLKEVAYFNLMDARDKLCLEVATQYFTFSLNKKLLDVQEEILKVSEKQFVSISSQYQQGIKTRKDFLRSKNEFRQAEIDLHITLTTIEKARVELMRLLGFDELNENRHLELIPLSVDENLLKTIPVKAPDITHHNQYKAADLQKKVYSNDVAITRKEYWPQLLIGAGANYSVDGYLTDPRSSSDLSRTNWNASITLRFNLLDWGMRSNSISISEAKKSQSESELDVKLNTLSADTQKLMFELKQSSINYDLIRELVDLQGQTYKFIEREYRSGKISYLDVIVAMRDLRDVKVKFYTSHFDLRRQLLRYKYYEGKLYDYLLQK